MGFNSKLGHFNWRFDSVFSLQVSQGNVPGVESASLAMDTEEGVEVVWNEVLFSDKKVFKAQEVLCLLVSC